MGMRCAPLRMRLAAFALILATASSSTVHAAVRTFVAPEVQKRVTDVPPTEQDLVTYRRRINELTINSKRDADRVEFLLALIDYAKASLDRSVSRLTREYYLSRLQNVVARQKAERPPRTNRGLAMWVPDGPIEQARRAGPSADPVCYHEGQEAECATDEEIAETQALADSAAYQNEQNQLGYDEAILMMYALDEVPDAAAIVSGPSAAIEACTNCWGQAATATATMGASVAAVLGWEGAKADALAAGTKLSKATRWSWHLTIVVTGLTAGYYLGSLVDCARNGRDPASSVNPAMDEVIFSLRRP